MILLHIFRKNLLSLSEEAESVYDYFKSAIFRLSDQRFYCQNSDTMFCSEILSISFKDYRFGNSLIRSGSLNLQNPSAELNISLRKIPKNLFYETHSQRRASSHGMKTNEKEQQPYHLQHLGLPSESSLEQINFFEFTEKKDLNGE